MSKDKFEKTKHNIRIEELDDTTRKKMFNKFVDAGGEVISERQKRHHMIMDKEKQRKYQKQIDKHRRNIRQPKPQTGNKTAVPANKKTKYIHNDDRSVLGKILIKFKIRLRLKLMRIAQFSGYYFNVKFLERFNNLYKPSLMEIQVIFLHLFRRDLRDGTQIIVHLDKQTPIYYELIENIGNIYDKMVIDQVVEHYLNFPDVPKKVSELRPVLMGLYRQLTLIKPYRSTIIDAYNKAIDAHHRVTDERGFAAVSMKRKMKNSVNVVFNKLYPRLHLLFCLFQNDLYDINDPVIEQILSINIEEKPGNRKGYSENEDEQPDEFDDDLPGSEGLEEKNDNLPDYVKQGLNLMYNLDLPALRKKYDDKGIFSYVSENDKILLIYILFNEFDKEYSFVLTTKKIKYNSDHMSAAIVDYKHKLLEMYDEMRSSHEALKAYANELRFYEKVRHERPVGSTQYIEYTNRLAAIEKRKNSAGRTARQTVKNYVDNLISVFDKIVKSLDGDNPLIANPQDVLEFDPMIEGAVKLEGKKIYRAILTVFNYLSALSYRLSDGGDLSGALIKNSNDPNGSSDAGQSDNKPPKEPKGILDELDDMV